MKVPFYFRMTVSLTFGARGLPNKDRFSKSDPFLVLFVLPEAGRPPKFVQRTETLKVGAKKVAFTNLIQNNLNPDWKALEVSEEAVDWSRKGSLLK